MSTERPEHSQDARRSPVSTSLRRVRRAFRRRLRGIGLTFLIAGVIGCVLVFVIRLVAEPTGIYVSVVSGLCIGVGIRWLVIDLVGKRAVNRRPEPDCACPKQTPPAHSEFRG